MIYFAYGSNMSSKRLLRRVRAAQVFGIGTLHAHRLAFQKVSDVDGSGKADIVTHDSEHVMGVLYRLDAEAKAKRSSARLYGVAESVRIGTLPLEIGGEKNDVAETNLLTVASPARLAGADRAGGDVSVDSR